jgi:uncharacterized OB-fold protein
MTTNTAAQTERILPIVTEENAEYWRSARAHALKLPFCMACEQFFYPAHYRCPACLGDKVEYRPVSGKGTVQTWNVMHQVYDPSFKDRAPYVVAVIRLEEGPQLVTNLLDTPKDEIRIDLPVRLVYEDLTDEIGLPQFTIDREARK